jgi:3-hydroxybutyryl-CoA dehydrogenase
VCIASGFNAISRDVSEEILQRSYKEIDGGLNRDVERGRLTAEAKAEMMKRLTSTTDISLMRNADLVIEAANEDRALKQRIFAELDQVCPPHTILTTNSSSIPITTIASATKRPDRCAKLHLWHPPQVLTYTEISRGYLTSDETWQTVKDVARALGRKPVLVVQDYQGGTNFYINACKKAKQYSNHWAWDLMLGTKTPQDIEAMPAVAGEAGGGLPPLASMDFIGIDTMVNIYDLAFEEYHLPQFATPPLLRRMVEAGHLGIKTGIGFYDYSQSGRRPEKLSPYLLRFLEREEPQAPPRPEED